MVDIPQFDSSIERLREALGDIRHRQERAEAALEQIAAGETAVIDAGLDVEKARIEELRRRQQAADAEAVALVTSLAETMNALAASPEGEEEGDGGKPFLARFTKLRRARRGKARTQPPIAELERVLTVSDLLLDLLRDDRAWLDDSHRGWEARLAGLVTRRKDTMLRLEESQMRLEALNAELFDVENHITAAPGHKASAELAVERAQAATAYDFEQSKAEEWLVESRLLERYLSLFRTVLDQLNGRLAARTVLIDKLAVDIEEGVMLYRSLAEASQPLASPGRPAAAGSGMVGTDPATPLQPRISELLEAQERTMISAQEIQRRRRLAEEAFAKAFGDEA